MEQNSQTESPASTENQFLSINCVDTYLPRQRQSAAISTLKIMLLSASLSSSASNRERHRRRLLALVP